MVSFLVLRFFLKSVLNLIWTLIKDWLLISQDSPSAGMINYFKKFIQLSTFIYKKSLRCFRKVRSIRKINLCSEFLFEVSYSSMSLKLELKAGTFLNRSQISPRVYSFHWVFKLSLCLLKYSFWSAMKLSKLKGSFFSNRFKFNKLVRLWVKHLFWNNFIASWICKFLQNKLFFSESNFCEKGFLS